jgi:NTE family protein
VTTDLADRCPVVLSVGAIIDALMASSAIPRVFPPVRIEGRRLIDGGVAANTPVAQAEALGAAEIYVLLTSPQIPRPISTGPDLMTRAARRVTGRRDTGTASRVAHRVPVHVLPVPTGAQPSMFDFTQTNTLIGRALTETRRWLASETLDGDGSPCGAARR